ncbi:flagellar hook-associated protein FlgK [bacterium (Candidatus Blackallbacteria) CG17_big_fil_post_rev_8_21_14_2_50_48_46]|uniref:Flagellar hook-associated protein 1 n=1 Tax=bacterium (Candidatus Blackallbacteria) CG17_big_fil_post_rev_8_21_14_2_50_48_46 TaxID=2014261 RepID=A0A2M7G4M2_9BACT|nr:MAG: flagellar hook-associated protein FlgK [bacterium (Candidatus Blackallbacteria) CG18_big_fil_WC_8_21_14_2_50_49_26]PIW16691.1 MAG: flagellar hook-associated protein FlgK [bacterium (Candidatus Blackallbacteria) CG17_big_fil_post_rev_8_21_14_2_50_48_46]PIW46197.1 MAG: flagellar hook-associated protein FlgK [bacterium (Candidatus Blackallbacteria) CG13_big_fil_rev_8_21_14_2_50_49_14]
MVRPAFLGFNIARSALFTAQQQLDLTGHNIANSGVEGYSRQRLHLQASPDIYGLGKAYPGSVGQGVQADQLQRLRDAFLDKEYRLKSQEQSYYQTRFNYASQMESSLGEMGSSGLGLTLDKFFNSWQEVSLRPDDLSLRQTVVAAGNDLSYSLRSFVADVTRLQLDTDRDLSQSVERVNKISESLAHLNQQISLRTNLGETPADLLDQRDRLLDELSGLIQIRTDLDSNGAVQVQSNGKALVVKNEWHALQLRTEPDQIRGQSAVGFPFTLNRGDLVINGVDILGSDAPLNIATAADAGLLVNQINLHTGQTGVVASLDAAGHLLMRSTSEASSFINIQETGVGLSLTGIASGDYTLTNSSSLMLPGGIYLNQPGGKIESLLNTKTQILPQTLDRVHQLSAALIRRVNTIHQNAYDLNGQNNRPFFTGTNPATIQVSGTLQADASLLALAADASFPPGDGSQARAVYQARFEVSVGGKSLETAYNALVTDMGTTIAQAQERAETLKTVKEGIDNQRQSIAGVNMDEELSNMLQFQRSFSAAARVMNTMDEMLNQIVNGLGAGR